MEFPWMISPSWQSVYIHKKGGTGEMARLEELTVGAVVRGLSPHGAVTIEAVKWYGSDALEVTYKDSTGRVEQEMLYRDREPTLEVEAKGRS